jgi:hypothetical protein
VARFFDETTIWFYTDRTHDRHRDYRHPGRHRDTLYSDYTQRARVTKHWRHQKPVQSVCTGYRRVTGCNANTNSFSANIGTNQVNSIVSITTVDDQITLVTEAVTEDALTGLQLVLIPTLVNDSVLT